MLEDYISRHKIITATVGIIITIIVLIGIITPFFSNTNSTNISQNTSNGIDGTGENTSLPFSNDIYSISAVVHNTITIDAPEQYRNAAIQQLYDSGIDPTNYKIVFTYENPFKVYE